MAADQGQAPNQDQFTDNQNYDVDIDKIYTNFIVEIDKIRSHLSVQNNPSLNTITSVTASQNPTNLTIDNNNVQESRCHAFYRLLGFPITDGESLYCPGLDKPNNSNQDINDNKLTTAQNIFKIPKMKELLDARENIPRSFLSIFSLQDVDAMVLAMSLAEIRPLTAPLKKLDGPLDINLNNQAYTSSLAARLITTVKNNGNNATNVNPQRQHILIPFIVDPRIDLNVFPKRNRLAVPFLKNKTEAQLTDNVVLKRPYIEKVCRDRFNSSNQTVKYGAATTDIINNIINNPFIKDDDLIKQAFNPNNITSETVQFSNYFNAIRSVLSKLYDAVRKITPVLAADPKSNGIANFNWTPIPNKTGPENGSTTRDLFSGQSLDTNNTSDDLNLIALLYSQGLANISNKLTTLQNADLGGFAFDGTELTPDQNSSDAMGDNTEKQISMFQNDRKNQTDAANDAIRHIEIIMGEFSGLGLLDILIITSAFWVIDKPTLISLLDDTAIERMSNNANLQDPVVLSAKNEAPMDPKSALQSFQNKVLEIYQVCEQLYLQIQQEST